MVTENMKIKLSYLILLLVISITLIGYNVISSQRVREEKLELEIEIDKQVYQPNSSIPIVIRLKNTGNVRLLINRRLSVNHVDAPRGLRDITFVVIGPDGEQIPFKASVNIGHLSNKDIIVLAPNRSIEVSDDIGTLYDIQQDGSYTIYAIYQNVIESDNNNSTWKGEITSNAIRFEIVP
jgi:hypothetical protein